MATSCRTALLNYLLRSRERTTKSAGFRMLPSHARNSMTSRQKRYVKKNDSRTNSRLQPSQSSSWLKFNAWIRFLNTEFLSQKVIVYRRKSICDSWLLAAFALQSNSFDEALINYVALNDMSRYVFEKAINFTIWSSMYGLKNSTSTLHGGAVAIAVCCFQRQWLSTLATYIVPKLLMNSWKLNLGRCVIKSCVVMNKPRQPRNIQLFNPGMMDEPIW